MSTFQNIVVKSNLGTDFALDSTNKLVHVNVDGSTIKRDAATGVLSAASGASADAGDILTTGSDGRAYLDITAINAAQTLVSLVGSKATGAPVLTFTNQAGTVSTIDLASLVTDISVSGGTYDPATTVLTLTQVSGPSITVNLGDLAKSTTLSSATVTVSGNGSAASPLSAAVNLSAFAGNALAAKTDGLYVAPGAGVTVNNTGHTVISAIDSTGVLSSDVVVDGSVTSNMVVSAPTGISVQPLHVTSPVDSSMTLSISGTPTTGQTVTGQVNVSATTPNLLTKNADGLFVSPVATVSGNGVALTSTIAAGAETITASVVIDSTTAGTNFASVSSAGVSVPATAIFDVEIQDLFGTHLVWARAGSGSTSPN